MIAEQACTVCNTGHLVLNYGNCSDANGYAYIIEYWKCDRCDHYYEDEHQLISNKKAHDMPVLHCDQKYNLNH